VGWARFSSWIFMAGFHARAQGKDAGSARVRSKRGSSQAAQPHKHIGCRKSGSAVEDARRAWPLSWLDAPGQGVVSRNLVISTPSSSPASGWRAKMASQRKFRKIIATAASKSSPSRASSTSTRRALHSIQEAATLTSA
jgi:hypothetical protein